MNLLDNDVLRYIKYIIIALIISYVTYRLYIPLVRISFPFLLSLILTYLLNPIVIFFEKKKLSKVLSIILTYLIILLILIIFVSILLPVIRSNLSDLIIKAPAIIEKYKLIINEIIIRYELSGLPSSIKQIINNGVQNGINLLNDLVLDTLSLIQIFVSNIFYIILIPIITFYFLADSDYLKQRLLLIFPEKLRDELIVTWYQIDLILKRFLRGELIVSIIVAVSTFIGLYLLGVRFPLILGLIAGITNFIPYIGPIIGLIPAVFVAFVDSPLLALKAGLVFIFIQQFESSIIVPKIVGECVGLHPITIIFSILLGEQLFGLIGMFFVLPITLIIMVVFNKIFNKAIICK